MFGILERYNLVPARKSFWYTLSDSFYYHVTKCLLAEASYVSVSETSINPSLFSGHHGFLWKLDPYPNSVKWTRVRLHADKKFQFLSCVETLPKFWWEEKR